MNTQELLKKAKSMADNKLAIDFLIKNHNVVDPKDLPIILEKVFVWFKVLPEKAFVCDFVRELIISHKIEKHSGLLMKYYWEIGDYENYKFSIHSEIGKLNPYDPWKYCSEMQKHQMAFGKYFHAKGLNDRSNAIQYLYSLISAEYFSITSKLISICDSQLSKYQIKVRRGKNDMEFYRSWDFDAIINGLPDRMFGKKSHGVECLKTIGNKHSIVEISDLIRGRIYSDFPKSIGIDPCIFNPQFMDLDSFALSIFNKSDFEDTLDFSQKLKNWLVLIGGKAVGLADDGTNEIIDRIVDGNPTTMDLSTSPNRNL